MATLFSLSACTEVPALRVSAPLSKVPTIEASGVHSQPFQGCSSGVAQSTDVLEDGGGAELDVAAARSKDPLPKAEPLHEVVRCSRPAGRVSRRSTAVASGMNVPSKVPRKMSRACLQGPWRTCQLWIGGSCVVNRCPSSFLVNPRAAPEGHPLDRDRRSPRPRRPSQPILPRRLAHSLGFSPCDTGLAGFGPPAGMSAMCWPGQSHSTSRVPLRHCTAMQSTLEWTR